MSRLPPLHQPQPWLSQGAWRIRGAPHACTAVLPQLAQLRTRGTSTIRFPDDAPLSIRTIYEWLGDDGVWRPRVVVTGSPAD